MATMWQRSYAYTRDHLTPDERERERQQERAWREQILAYHCQACGYVSKNWVQPGKDGLFCPGCGSAIEVRKLFAMCPRCHQEHNVTFLAENRSMVEPDLAAKEVCLDCKFAGKRLPKAFKERGATVPLRIERIERSEINA